MSNAVLKYFRISLVIFVVYLLSVSDCLAQSRITGIQAKLFYQNTGAFSEDIFSTPSDLWNVCFDYVYSTLVIVEVRGKENGKQFDKPQKIELIAKYKPFEGTKKEVMIRRNSPIWFDENGQTNIGFWIDNVGCHPVKLFIKISGQKAVLRKTINFGCGE